MSGALIMALVGAVVGLAGLGFLVSPAKTEAGIYRRRIAGTMAVAFAVVLFGFAYSLHSWQAPR